MGRNSNIFTHIRYDTNATKHIGIGAIVGIVGAFTGMPCVPVTAALAAGITIEVYQRLTGGHNTMRESVMDALTTTLGGLIVAVIMQIWEL